MEGPNAEVVRRDSFRHARVEVRHLEEVGDRVACAITLRARGRGSGVDVEFPQSHLWTIRDGKAVRFEWSPDTERAFRALGDR